MPKTTHKKMIILSLIVIMFVSVIPFKLALADVVTTTPDNPSMIKSLMAGGFGLDSVACSVGLAKCDASGKKAVDGQPEVREIIIRIIQILLGFTSLLAMIMVIIGGITWATAAGNEDRVQKGKKILVWAAIGVVVLMGAWSIITYVMYLMSTVLNRT